jgi:hypothetical protein
MKRGAGDAEHHRFDGAKSNRVEAQNRRGQSGRNPRREREIGALAVHEHELEAPGDQRVDDAHQNANHPEPA